MQPSRETSTEPGILTVTVATIQPSTTAIQPSATTIWPDVSLLKPQLFMFLYYICRYAKGFAPCRRPPPLPLMIDSWTFQTFWNTAMSTCEFSLVFIYFLGCHWFPLMFIDFNGVYCFFMYFQLFSLIFIAGLWIFMIFMHVHCSSYIFKDLIGNSWMSIDFHLRELV